MATIDEVMRTLRRRLEAVSRGVATEALGRLVQRSPIRTGLFVNNWNVGVGTVDTTTRDDVDPSGGQAVARGQTTIAQASLGATIAISNSVPYASALEHGSSQQAPQGMVALTAAEVPQIVDVVVRSVARA